MEKVNDAILNNKNGKTNIMQPDGSASEANLICSYAVAI
jgi:hypothetical protein